MREEWALLVTFEKGGVISATTVRGFSSQKLCEAAADDIHKYFHIPEDATPALFVDAVALQLSGEPPP